MFSKTLAVLLVLAACFPAFGDDEFRLCELLAPETHQFAITYDVAATHEGDLFFLNPIRPGSLASKECVIERSTDKELLFIPRDLAKPILANCLRPTLAVVKA